MNEAIKKLIEGRSLDDIANALEIAVEANREAHKIVLSFLMEDNDIPLQFIPSAIDKIIAKANKQIQAIAEGKGNE